MKSIKILFTVILSVVIFTACQKSDKKPAACGFEKSGQTETSINTQPAGRMQGSALSEGGTTKENFVPAEIVGSGDDDRDGGDKKAKAVGR